MCLYSIIQLENISYPVSRAPLPGTLLRTDPATHRYTFSRVRSAQMVGTVLPEFRVSCRADGEPSRGFLETAGFPSEGLPGPALPRQQGAVCVCVLCVCVCVCV